MSWTTGPTGIKRGRPPRQRRGICVHQWCVMSTCTCKLRWISSGLITDISASLPVFEDGIKACDEKVRNVRNTANSQTEKKKISTSFWNKSIIDFFFLDRQVFACFFWRHGFFFSSSFFLPHRPAPNDFAPWFTVNFCWARQQLKTSGGFKSGVLALYLH